MIKRTIYIGNAAYLNKADEQLTVTYQEDGAVKTVPVEDLGLVVLDHQQITITQGLVNALLANNAVVLWCDDRHLPNGLLLPFTENHAFTQKVRYQLNASRPLQKQLWKQTVQAKINNQKRLLEHNEIAAEPMGRWEKHVGSGDPKNLEGRAAAYYWRNFFQAYGAFWRDPQGDPPNNLLNYGYAILRAIVARSLVSSGMLPVLGIHHRNKYNPFCLADDIMEPYRPFVDQIVWELVKEYAFDFPDTLTNPLKQAILSLPNRDVYIEGETSPLMVATQRTSASLMSCFDGSRRKIKYPAL